MGRRGSELVRSALPRLLVLVIGLALLAAQGIAPARSIAQGVDGATSATTRSACVYDATANTSSPTADKASPPAGGNASKRERAASSTGDLPRSAAVVVAAKAVVRDALTAARAKAAAVRAAGGNIPTMTTAAVDRTTGRVWTRISGNTNVYVPPELAAKLPASSLEPWATTNCAEVAACSAALQGGADLSNLVSRGVDHWTLVGAGE
jgi:hypothetical protein